MAYPSADPVRAEVRSTPPYCGMGLVPVLVWPCRLFKEQHKSKKDFSYAFGWELACEWGIIRLDGVSV